MTMKGSVVASAVMHGLVLTWALVSISAPASFEVADVEALPVDIIPITDVTQIQQGDKSAPVKDKAAPVPTEKPQTVPNAENMGENEVDLKTPPTPSKKPSEVEAAAAPKKSENNAPVKDAKANDVKEVAKEETDVAPTDEVAALLKPSEQPKPDPKPEVTTETPPEQPAETAEEQLPENVPVPAVKPKPQPPEKPKEAEKKPDTKATEAKTKTDKAKKIADKKQEMAKSSSQQESDFNADEIAALLNKQDASGGGAKASKEEAAFGGKKTTGGSSLSQSEIDALRGQIAQNWSVIAGLEGMDEVRIRVKMSLDESGDIVGEPEVEASGGPESTRRALEGAAYRAVRRSAPFRNLPVDKYDAWSEVIVNFDPSNLAG